MIMHDHVKLQQELKHLGLLIRVKQLKSHNFLFLVLILGILQLLIDRRFVVHLVFFYIWYFCLEIAY